MILNANRLPPAHYWRESRFLPCPGLDQNVLEVFCADFRLEDGQKHGLVRPAAVGVDVEAIAAGNGFYGH